MTPEKAREILNRIRHGISHGDKTPTDFEITLALIILGDLT